MTDADLVHAAWSGDAGALGALLERHRAPLYASALSILRNAADAQDAVQDAVLVALRRIGDLRDPSAAAAWLRTIVRSTCLMRLRSSREDPAQIGESGLADVSDPAEALEGIALRDWVWDSLQQLSEQLRMTVMLRFFSSRRSYADIAALLGIPVGTVRSRLHQAKTRLGAILLEEVSAKHPDHSAFLASRWRSWSDCIEALHRDATAAAYFADCSRDALVEAPAHGYLAHGTGNEAKNIEASVASGVRLRLTGIAASPGITILDGELLSPTHDPGHCPPSRTEVRIHPDGQTTRLVLLEGPTESDS